MHVRRRRACVVQVRDQVVPDMRAFLRGEVVLAPRPCAELLCPLTGSRIALEPEDLRLLGELAGEEWTSAAALEREGKASAPQLQRLLAADALVSDQPDHASLRASEERLRRTGWHELAAVYNAHTRWSGVSGTESTREHTTSAEAERLVEHIAEYGEPPSHFVQRPDAVGNVPLDLPEEDELLRTLRQRRTIRAFRTGDWLPRRQLEYVLHGTFGVHGMRALPRGIVALKRTSPSGGGLHPIEAYVICVRVEGVPVGLYHYRTDDHSLDLLQPLDDAQAREMVTLFTAGQAYFSEAHAVAVHVARFDRHFWKYIDHAKAFKAVLMDSAHLSQTLYMLATRAGLGAYVTAAINDADIATALELDPLTQAAVAINGFGITDPTRRELLFDHEPFVPERLRARIGADRDHGGS